MSKVEYRVFVSSPLMKNKVVAMSMSSSAKYSHSQNAQIWTTAKCYLCSSRRLAVVLLVMLALCAVGLYVRRYGTDDETLIIVITPTYKRLERMAEMTRLSQALMNVRSLLWIVVEDGNRTSPLVSRLLERAGIPFLYQHVATEAGHPGKGWPQRNLALGIVRERFRHYRGNAVVYFADDDNAYDLRVFDYVRRVTTIGFWAVGLSGGSMVESPRIANDTITGWDVTFAKRREFATDMAGFAVNLGVVLSTTAHFGKDCFGRHSSPEDCFLSQLKIPKEQAQAFGYDRTPKEVLVWHTKTCRPNAEKGTTNGYEVEE